MMVTIFVNLSEGGLLSRNECIKDSKLPCTSVDHSTKMFSDDSVGAEGAR